jgi:hypothetical protein
MSSVFLHPYVPRCAVLAEDDPQIQFSGLDHRVVTVSQQCELRRHVLGETLCHLVVDQPLDAIHRRRFHGHLLELTPPSE